MRSPLAKKVHALGACAEGRDWLEAGNYTDFLTTWRACPATEFLAWLATRLLGLEGARGALACARAAGSITADPLLAPCIHLAESIAEKRSKDLEKDLVTLQEHAYDCTARALEGVPSGEALLAASYAAYAVVMATQASLTKDPAAKTQMILKAAQHASDACAHAWEAMPGKNRALPQILREAVKEDALLRAWSTITAPATTTTPAR